METQPVAKRRPGRPPMDQGQPANRINVSLDNETLDRIKALGIGNLSAWVRGQVAKAWTRRK